MSLNFGGINIGGNNGGGGGGTTDHSQLTNLDYASAGHTGFLKDDASNLTTNGKKAISDCASVVYSAGISAGLPTNPTSATTDTYTCPSNGFFVIGVYKGTAGYSFYLSVNGVNRVQMISFSGGVGVGFVIPVAKNDVIRLYTDEEAANWTVNQQVFVPMKGE